MSAAVDDKTLRMSRIFDAEPERVFAAWTNPDHFAAWLGPHGVKTLECQLDARPGGAWRLRGESGTNIKHAVSGTYLAVDPPRFLSFTWGWHTGGDFAGARPNETTISITFRAVGKRTEMTFMQTGFPDATSLGNHDSGWTASFEKLATLLETKA
jgi:uncharacterized protein YndB with AHSA1/START domain